jgi:hypothetical protein
VGLIRNGRMGATMFGKTSMIDNITTLNTISYICESCEVNPDKYLIVLFVTILIGRNASDINMEIIQLFVPFFRRSAPYASIEVTDKRIYNINK